MTVRQRRYLECSDRAQHLIAAVPKANPCLVSPRDQPMQSHHRRAGRIEAPLGITPFAPPLEDAIVVQIDIDVELARPRQRRRNRRRHHGTARPRRYLQCYNRRRATPALEKFEHPATQGGGLVGLNGTHIPKTVRGGTVSEPRLRAGRKETDESD